VNLNGPGLEKKLQNEGIIMRYFRILISVVTLYSIVLVNVGAELHNVKPVSGYVPDKTTAVRVAEAILKPIYGETKIEKEKPFEAKLTGNIWHVQGSLPVSSFPMPGGVAEIWIDKRDCRIIRVTHGK
jgi:hypothetical protein